MDPMGADRNFAVFGGTDDERISVIMNGIRRCIHRQAVIVLHDSFQLESALQHTYRPVVRINIGQRSFDPLIGVTYDDAMQTRQTLKRIVREKGIVTIRVPPTDQGLQRMLARELTGLTYENDPFLLVLFGVRHTAEGPLVELAIGERGGHYFTAIAGMTASGIIGQNRLPQLLQSYEEILFLPTEDMQEAQQVSNCFGSYMRTQEQASIQRRGIWPFRRNERSLTYLQSLTNTINPQSLRSRTLICGTSFREPILVNNLVLKG